MLKYFLKSKTYCCVLSLFFLCFSSYTTSILFLSGLAGSSVCLSNVNSRVFVMHSWSSPVCALILAVLRVMI